MNKIVSSTEGIGSHVQLFFYKVPKKNNKTLSNNLKQFRKWYGIQIGI
jgi:hypothetical protein